MLQEKLNECRVLITEVAQNQQQNLENQNLAKRNNTFFDSYEKYLVPVIKGYYETKKMDDILFSDSLLSNIHWCVEYSKKTFDSRVVVNPKKFQDTAKQVSDKISEEWSQQINQKLAGVKDELNILKLVSNNKFEIQKILVVFNDFSNWPVNQGKIEQYEKALCQANDILDTMQFDEEIEEFLRKVKDKNATLLDLSDSIISWIRREHLENNIMLSIKN